MLSVQFTVLLIRLCKVLISWFLHL